jgi:hypothetical protein
MTFKHLPFGYGVVMVAGKARISRKARERLLIWKRAVSQAAFIMLTHT